MRIYLLCQHKAGLTAKMLLKGSTLLCPVEELEVRAVSNISSVS